MFEKFVGLGELLTKSNQSIDTLNKHPSIIHFRKCLNKRQVRLGCGESLSIQISYNKITNNSNDSIILSKEEEEDEKNLLIMFNLHPRQDQFESEFSSSKKSTTELLLANSLLKEFALKSSACVVDRIESSPTFLKIILEPNNEIAVKFFYSPAYLRFATESSPMQVIAKDMLKIFHQHLEDKSDYMMDENLKGKIDQYLENHLLLGIRGQREGYASSTSRLGFFLTGIPGIGKSTFVGVFAAGLKEAVRANLYPKFDVKVVKIPLNAMTPQTLNHVLCIQGISDWSVERVVEQALTKGHSVILHLEECPEDLDLLDRLFSCIERMLKKLFVRYPEYVSNIIFLFTSNHHVSQKVEKFVACVCSIKPPTEIQQKKWLKKKLQQKLNTSFCDIKSYPKISKTGDVRPLNAWWLSISHALLKSKEEGDVSANTAFVERENDKDDVLKVGWNEKVTCILQSYDGYFYFDTKIKVHHLSFKNSNKKTKAIMEMVHSGFLTPGVIVLKGDEKWQKEIEGEILNELDSLEPTNMHVTEVELLDSSDESKILGEPGEIRGGLFRIIDDATNPNASNNNTKKAKLNDGKCDLCIVFARVNEIGSILLRELLESGDKSRTHRLGISKQGLLFIVSLVENSQVTPQLESRAQQIIFQNETE